MSKTYIKKEGIWKDNADFKVGDYFPFYVAPEYAQYNTILDIQPYTGKFGFRFVFTFPLSNGKRGQVAIE